MALCTSKGHGGAIPQPNWIQRNLGFSVVQIPYYITPQPSDRSSCETDHLGCHMFEQTKNDNQFSPSIQDNAFMKMIKEGL